MDHLKYGGGRPWILVSLEVSCGTLEDLVIVLQEIFTLVTAGIRAKQFLLSLVESYLVVC